MTTKLRPLRKLKQSRENDSVKYRHAEKGFKNNMELLDRAKSCWENMRNMREKRQRCFRFVYGDQWGDLINVNYKTITEREYISARNRTPLTNNVTRRLVNATVGTFLKEKAEPVGIARNPEKKKDAEMLTMALQSNWQSQNSNMEVLLATVFEDYIIGGFVFSRESWSMFEGDWDTYTYMPNPAYCFLSSTMRDPLNRDMNLIGEIHDITPNEFFARFKGMSNVQIQDLKAEYGELSHSPTLLQLDEKNDLRYLDFYGNNNPDLYRVYEIWTKEIKQRVRCWDVLKGTLFKCEIDNINKTALEEYGHTIEEENNQRMKLGLMQGMDADDIPLIDYGQLNTSNEKLGMFYDEYWYYQFLTPRGTILKEGESPYEHGHPYSVSFYPFVNGQVQSFIEDVIPQQKYINRLVSMQDMIMRSTAKGVLLIDKRSIAYDSSREEIKDQWGDPDGVIVYDSTKGGEIPRQVANQSTNVGADTMLSLQLKLMEDISGIHGATQGKDALSGQSAALYAQQASNASTMILNILQRFEYFIRSIAIKKMKNIQQFYNEPRYINIVGREYAGVKEYDPKRAKDLECYISIVKQGATPVASAIQNQLFIDMWRNGAISAKALLQGSDLPFADKMLRVIEAEEQKLAMAEGSGQQPQVPQIDPTLMNQMQTQLGQSDVVNNAENIIRNANNMSFLT